MLEGIDSRPKRVMHPFQAHGVRGHLVMLAVCFIHDGVKLFRREGGNAMHYAVLRPHALVGVNCMTNRGCAANHVVTFGCVCVP